MNHLNHLVKGAGFAAAGVALIPLFGWWYSAAEKLPWWHGAYCALGAAVTAGGDCVNRGAGYGVATAEFVVLVPLFTCAVTLAISHFTTRNVHKAMRGERKLTRPGQQP